MHEFRDGISKNLHYLKESCFSGVKQLFRRVDSDSKKFTLKIRLRELSICVMSIDVHGIYDSTSIHQLSFQVRVNHCATRELTGLQSLLLSILNSS